MPGMVLDSSVILAMLLPDEVAPDLHNLQPRIAAGEAIVPLLWPLEIANTLLVAERRGRLTAEHRRALLQRLMRLPVVLDQETAEHAWGATLDLALSLGLTSYDATYLELARRRSLPLASYDRRLCDAARRAGIDVLTS